MTTFPMTVRPKNEWTRRIYDRVFIVRILFFFFQEALSYDKDYQKTRIINCVKLRYPNLDRFDNSSQQKRPEKNPEALLIIEE